MPADLLFLNGPVLTMNPDQPVADAVAVLGERIVAVGDLATVRAEQGPRTRVIDLAGRALIPGFNDNHTHPIIYGRGLRAINAKPDAIATLAELQTAYRAAAADPATPEWLLARGYDDTRLDIQRHPTRWDLDPATGNRPAFLTRTCGHIGVANSAALALAGITASTPAPQGGEIDHDANGEPTGVLRETAMRLVMDLMPKPTVADIKDDLRAAGDRFRAYGITSTAEAMLSTADELAAYQELRTAGELPFRVNLMMMIDDTLDELISLGIKTGFGDDWLRIGPAKLFQDGSGGGKTAAMFDAYHDDPNNYGISIWTQQELDDKFGRAHAAGFQLCAHAIGDRAITMILDAYEKALAAHPRKDHRHRIEHCGFCPPPLLDRMRLHKFVAVPQPNFTYELGDSYIRNFTERQLAYCYPNRSWFDYGIVSVGSSDVPVVSCDPFMGIRSAVTRLTRDGQHMGLGQGVTVMEALQMFTRNGAYATFEEDRKGTIAPGMLADLALLSDDPRAVDPELLHTLKCDLTVLGGSIVHEA